ncbi:MAG: GIY-YIG nuclease family protein [Campylobacterota bacterium]|nr:GIY-YIG nuclease family protein [Campylobacterota bacterium]
MKQAYIYIMSNRYKGTLYVGVTSNLIKRVFEHKNGLSEGFTKRYALKSLVYYEIFDDITDAIFREKQLKGGSRKKKVELIEKMNLNWSDLYGEIV